jgi:SpoVK/Ycf46/Vps4 family AAA+-type ATPase
MNFIHFLFRELFVMAREHSPSIIFMDEIDSIGSSRMESGSGGGDSEVQRTMLELLNQLDGFEPHQNIKVGTVRGFNFLFIFRLLWRQIESTFLTALFFDLDVSTG